MGQGFKVYSSSELYCKWPKVAETMTEAYCSSYKFERYQQIQTQARLKSDTKIGFKLNY
jgi:hypothetical protein